MSNYTGPDKITGDPHSAAEFNAFKTVMNSKFGYEDVATYADISNSTEVRLIIVNVDENNNGDASMYVHTGSTVRFLFTIQPIS